MADKNSEPIPDRWKLVTKQKGGSSVSFYTCPETGQKFNTYEDLMRYVTYAKASKLSIYAPDFSPKKRTRKTKKNVSKAEVEETAKSSDSEGSMFNLPSITSLDLMDEDGPSQSDKQSATGQPKSENCSSSDACSSNKRKGKGKKQKKKK